MTCRNLIVGALLAVLLFFQALPLSAADTDNKTVFLSVHVPSTAG